MIQKIKILIKKYRELFTYIIFGVLTTLVSLVTFKASNLILGEERYLISNIISWVIAVAFAYVTNKLWVFESKSWSGKTVVKEIAGFFSARLFSLGCEELGLWLLVDVASMGRISLSVLGFTVTGSDIAKLIMQFAVVVLNYIFSKFLVFRKKNKN